MRKSLKKDHTKELLQLLKKKAFFKETITLSSGKASSYYIDGRLVTLSAYGAWLCAEVVLSRIAKEKISAIGGPTIGADPLVGAIAALSFLRRKPLNTFIIRSTPKAHGKKQLIEGPRLKKGSEVIIIDDVATTGGSLIKSIQALRACGVTVRKALVLVDRQEGAAENLAKEGCRLISLFKASEFLT